MSQFVNPRKPESDVHPQFVDRWSPRSFDETVLVTRNQIDSVLEAARWAPSCFNEQPWRIFVAAKPSAMFDKFLGALVEKNQCWAKSASALMFIACSLTFKRNNKPNNWAEFDTGSAWISMALQAQVLGLHMHAMAGFDTA
jgi:nitroreductase